MKATRTASLQEFVQQHQVRFQSRPLTMHRLEQRVQVGYELELRAAHPVAHQEIHPGCPQCGKLYQGLKQLADASLPPPGRPTGYEIGPVDFAWHYSPSRNSRPEVVLKVRISHRQDFFNPIDECEKRCLAQMTEALRRLGACSGRWRPSASDGGAPDSPPPSDSG